MGYFPLGGSSIQTQELPMPISTITFSLTILAVFVYALQHYGTQVPTE